MVAFFVACCLVMVGFFLEGVSMVKLMPKQDKFCQLYIETGNASEAYRQSYNAQRMQTTTVNRKASELLDSPKIQAHIDELQAQHRRRHAITVDDLLDELEQARTAALMCETPQISAAVSATMGKAKILGFDKQVVDHTSSDGSMATRPTVIELIAPTHHESPD